MATIWVRYDLSFVEDNDQRATESPSYTTNVGGYNVLVYAPYADPSFLPDTPEEFIRYGIGPYFNLSRMSYAFYGSAPDTFTFIGYQATATAVSLTQPVESLPTLKTLTRTNYRYDGNGQVIGQGELTVSAYDHVWRAQVVVDSTVLFSIADNVVNFRSTLPDQQQAIIGGADLYHALDGNDTVTLPNSTTIAGVASVSWNFNATFEAGAGNDVVTGGAGDDKIDGGIGRDTIIGSPGADSLRGGSDDDTFDFKTNGFVGFGTSTSQTIDGGSDGGAVAPDVLLLPGSADLYSFSVNLQNNWHDTHTTVSSKLPLASVNLDTQDVEKVRFSQPVQNVVAHTNVWSALGYQIEKSYSNSTAAAVTSRNWHPVAAMELGILPKDYASSANSSYEFKDGVYRHVSGSHDSVATVLSGVLSGKRTLSISFKGSDDPGDFSADVIPLGGIEGIYNNEFSSLRSGLIEYLKEFGNQYDRIYVSGHSLGGSLSQFLQYELSGLVGKDKLIGLTFGSLGAGLGADEQYSLVNLMHTIDIAQNAPSGGDRAGTTIFLNSKHNRDRITAHFQEGYQEDLQLLNGFARDAFNLFYGHQFAAALRNGDLYRGGDLQLSVWDDTGNTIISARSDDYVLAGDGNDRILLDPSSLRASSDRMIDGGSGNDILKVSLFIPTAPSPYSISDFVFSRDGGVFTLSHRVSGSIELVAHYHDIEEVQLDSFRFTPDGTRIAGPSAALAPRDFNGDGVSDMLWRSDGGNLVSWNQNGGHVQETNSFGLIPSNWKVTGTGDFNGDAKVDLLWRSDAGTLVSWDIDNGQVLRTNDFGVVPSNWKIVGSGDFNGDAKSDFLWRSDAGTLVTWNINDGQVLQTNDFGLVPSNWKIAGTGDFNGDGKSDFLFRSDAGTLVTWNIDDGRVLRTNDFGLLPSNWQVAGIGDFNGDGKSDFLFRSQAGTLVSWDIDDGRVIRTNDFGVVPSNWKIASIGDFNGDGKSDFLWRSDAGTVATWDIDDGRVLRSHDFGVAPTDWHIV